MANRLDSSIIRGIVEIKAPDDPLMMLLVTYLGAAFHASLFGGWRAFMTPHHDQLLELFNGPPINASLQKPDLRNIQRVSHELELVYRIAVFDSFLNNLTTYALAARPSKATGSAQMHVSILLGKTRAQIVNEYIARRTKSLSRENFATRIQALREITDVDFQLSKDDFDNLKRLSHLRNTIVHEGAGFQFTVDEELKIHSQAQMQTVKMGDERFDVITRIAALLYEQYVRQFIGRDLIELERNALAALNPVN